MTIIVPEPSLVVLIGPSGSGKSTFARRCFRPTEVLSSDAFRALVSDDENDQAATPDAFELLHAVTARRLARRRLTVIDATSVKPEDRKPLLELARRFHYLTAAIVFNLPPEVCVAHDSRRDGRRVGPAVVRAHVDLLRRSLDRLEKEGFQDVFVLSSAAEAAAAVVERRPLPIDRRHDPGPFDLIGDVHGCFDELVDLMRLLGYAVSEKAGPGGRPAYAVRPPAGRKAVFVGDLVDRGPSVPAVLRLVMDMVEAGTALCVCGNHDDKLRRFIEGHDVKVGHGLAQSLAQLEPEPAEFKERVHTFLDQLLSHYLLDGGRLVVAHGGLKEELQGRVSSRVRSFCLYGETTGETDEFGLPVRLAWAAGYRGAATVVYGHTPVPEAEWINRTINIDTGCVFGGRLTALRWPEKELVSVPARRVWCEPGRPFLPSSTGPAQTES
jgi:protein phosphatase